MKQTIIILIIFSIIEHFYPFTQNLKFLTNNELKTINNFLAHNFTEIIVLTLLYTQLTLFTKCKLDFHTIPIFITTLSIHLALAKLLNITPSFSIWTSTAIAYSTFISNIPNTTSMITSFNSISLSILICLIYNNFNFGILLEGITSGSINALIVKHTVKTIYQQNTQQYNNNQIPEKAISFTNSISFSQLINKYIKH